MSKVVRPPKLKPIDLGARPGDETIRGVAPTRTVGETYAPEAKSKLEDYLELFKVRVTSLVVLNAWAGFVLAAHKHGASYFSLRLVATLVGVACSSAGAAALNQVFERDADARMSRTKDRPLPAKRMSAREAFVAARLMIIAGTLVLTFEANWITGVSAFLTVLAYAFVYTPLKSRTYHATFVGAFPGGMPPVLGWIAVSGKYEIETAALFAIVFLWQFPHFLSIGWLYREDYERGGIRILPVLDPSGRATVRQILLYSLLLLPISLWPFFVGLTGWVYLFGAIAFSIAYLAFGIRLALLRLPPTSATSKKEARELLRASVVYLPLLLGLLVITGVFH